MFDDKKVKVKNTTVIDPSFVFTLYIEDGSPFDAWVTVNIRLSYSPEPKLEPVIASDSTVSINGLVNRNELDFQVPFAYDYLQLPSGKEFNYTLIVSLTENGVSGPAPSTIRGTATYTKSL